MHMACVFIQKHTFTIHFITKYNYFINYTSLFEVSLDHFVHFNLHIIVGSLWVSGPHIYIHAFWHFPNIFRHCTISNHNRKRYSGIFIITHKQQLMRQVLHYRNVVSVSKINRNLYHQQQVSVLVHLYSEICEKQNAAGNAWSFKDSRKLQRWGPSLNAAFWCGALWAHTERLFCGAQR